MAKVGSQSHVVASVQGARLARHKSTTAAAAGNSEDHGSSRLSPAAPAPAGNSSSLPPVGAGSNYRSGQTDNGGGGGGQPGHSRDFLAGQENLQPGNRGGQQWAPARQPQAVPSNVIRHAGLSPAVALPPAAGLPPAAALQRPPKGPPPQNLIYDSQLRPCGYGDI